MVELQEMGKGSRDDQLCPNANGRRCDEQESRERACSEARRRENGVSAMMQTAANE